MIWSNNKFHLFEKFKSNLYLIQLAANMTKKLSGEFVITERKKNYAIKQYKRGEFSFGQTAKFAGISVWDLPSLLKQKGVHLNYDLDELKKDLEIIKLK